MEEEELELEESDDEESLEDELLGLLFPLVNAQSKNPFGKPVAAKSVPLKASQPDEISISLKTSSLLLSNKVQDLYIKNQYVK